MRFLWVHANSSINQNGIDLSTWKGSDVALTQGTTANSNLGITIAEASSVKYTIVDGSLPTGVTLTEDGKLTGKPTVAGDYTIKVTCVADNWINATRVFNIKVASAFTVDTTTGTVGDEDFYLAISSDTVQVTNQQTQSLTYTLVDGKLPDGLTLNADGSIEGTPTTAGVYDLTFRIDLSEQSGGGGYRPSQTTVTSYEYKVTLTIADAEKDEEDVVLSISSMEIDSEGQQLVLTLSDGQTVNVALATNDTDSGEEDAVLSITSMEVDSDGQLVLTLSDGQMVNTGLTASDTEIKAIKNVEINSDGELVLTFNDDTTSNLGKVVGANGTDGTPGASVTGEKGDKGDKGDAGETVNATAGLVLAIVALVAALAAGGVVVYVLLKKKN
jgi:hypothetical protein